MMLLKGKSYILRQLFNVDQKFRITSIHSSPVTDSEIERIVKIINDHPFPDNPLHPTLCCEIPPAVLSTPLVEQILGDLFAAHSNGLKAYELFKYCLESDVYTPSSDAFEKTIHILTRMRYFDKAWELMERIKQSHPHLLTLKSMSIVLSRIAKYQSYEETLDAFKKMETCIYTGSKFGTNEFNVLLRAFCTQRRMEEARSIYNKMHTEFPPNIKTMNILLLGFKESGDVTAVELFYHEMIRRGFEPNYFTYSIRIDAYSKKGHLGDALRLLEEMEVKNFSPTLEIMTTLIHGAGLAQNFTKAKQLFEDIPKRGLQPDTGAYNALLNVLVRSRDMVSAIALMDKMHAKNIEHDDVTYHTVFSGLMRVPAYGVVDMYARMIEKNFVPKMRTVVMLMKFFCENDRIDLGLGLWNYLMKKGQCPHNHSLDLLVIGLCARGRVQEALYCSKQLLDRGRAMSELACQTLQKSSAQIGELDKFEELEVMMKKLKKLLPPITKHVSRSNMNLI